MTLLVTLFAFVGVVGGIYAAVKADVQVAGLAIALVGLAVLIPILVRS